MLTGEEVRVIALKAAVRYYQDKQANSDIVVRMAQRFETYITRGN